MTTKKEKCPCGKMEEYEEGGYETCTDSHCPCSECHEPYFGNPPSQSESIEWEKDFVESGASIEHDRWARWQKHMFSKMVEEERFEEGSHFKTGNYILPKEFVDRWFRQIDTHYSELSEAEKESDRKESRTYIPLVQQAITTAVAKRDAFWQKNEERRLGKYEALGYHKGKMAERKRLADEVEKEYTTHEDTKAHGRCNTQCHKITENMAKDFFLSLLKH
jgi:hypothetical protein